MKNKERALGGSQETSAAVLQAGLRRCGTPLNNICSGTNDDLAALEAFQVVRSPQARGGELTEIRDSEVRISSRMMNSLQHECVTP